MVDAIRRAHRFGLAALLMFVMACAEGDARTRPPSLAKPVRSCQAMGLGRGFELPTWNLFVTDANWNTLHEDIRADVEVEAQVCIDGVLETIGLELQGNSSRSRDKKSFKLKLKRDHELAQLGLADHDDADAEAPIDKVYLKAQWVDQSLVRETVSFDLWRELGHTAPRTGFANLRINGDYWGLYQLLEPVDTDYVKRNGYPRGGQLYKATRKNGSRADFEPGRNLVKAFEDKSDDEDDGSRADLERLMTALQETPLELAAFEREIDPVFPLDDYIDRMVWVAFTRNVDAVAQNFYMYNAPRDGHDAWFQIPWDSDLCMGSAWRDRDEVVPPRVLLMVDGGTYFGRRLTEVPELRARYVQRFRRVMDEVLTEHVLLGHLDRHAARVRRDLELDQARWQRHMAPDEAFDVIRDYLRERPGYMRAGLDRFTQPEHETTAGSTADDDVE